MRREARIYNREKTVSSASGVTEAGQPPVISEVRTYPHTIPKNKLKMVSKDLVVRTETIKLLEENLGGTLFDKDHSSIFLDQSLKRKEIKAKLNKWGLIKLKSFCIAKETINKMKKHPTNWEEIFANDITDQRLISNVYKKCIQLRTKKQTKYGLKS